MAYKGDPIGSLEPLAKAGIPLIHVIGDADQFSQVLDYGISTRRRS